MRNLAFYMATLVAIASVACGPSSKEVATAKSSRYKGDKLEIFAATKAVVSAKYNIAKTDETTLGMQTQARWYSPEGLAVSSTVEDDRDLPDKSILMAMAVTMLPDGDAWVIKVSPVMQRKNRGMPKPEELKEGDPSLPGWVESRLDQLALDIHKALDKYRVQSVPGAAPPPAEPPPPAPDEPSTGSAAGTGASGSATATPP